MADPALDYDYDRIWTYKDYKEWELKPGDRYVPCILRMGDTLKSAQFSGFEIPLDVLFSGE